MTEVGYDGTFFVVPPPFYQLWILFFIKDNQYFPAASVLYLGKTTEMYRRFWIKMKELMPKWKPTSAGGDLEKAAQNAAEQEMIGLIVSFCLFHSSQAVIKNNQLHGLSGVYEHNSEYRNWLRLILSVPMLPPGMITEAYRFLLSMKLKMNHRADQTNLGRFKRYIARNWGDPKRMKPENLSCWKREQACNNGPECFNGFLRREIRVHHCNFWTFQFHYVRILRFKYREYQRLKKHGAGNVVRGRKQRTIDNLEVRRAYEIELENGRITWFEFLGHVSYMSDDLISNLQNRFHENGNRVDDPRVVIDPDDINGDSTCVNCHFEIEEKAVLNCGDDNVCLECIKFIQDNPPSICPNDSCGETITRVSKIRTRK